LRITLIETVLAADAHTPAILHGYIPFTAGPVRNHATQSTLATTPQTPQPPKGIAPARHITDNQATQLQPDWTPHDLDVNNPAARLDWCTNQTLNTRRPHPPPTRLLAEELAIQATDAYQPSLRLRATIIQRDQTCRYPTCQVPAWRCQLDHIHPFTTDLPAWAQTTETNL